MRIVILALALAGLLAGPAEAADAAKGKKVFKKCAACHRVGPTAKNALGPVLNGVVDRPFGVIEDYRYSKNLLALGEEGRVWDVETLDAYLTKPKAMIPKGKMAFAGLRKESDRANVIEYLRGFDLEGNEK